MSLNTNLVSYYNLVSDANDSLGAFNGTPTSISYVSGGPDGQNWALFTRASSSRISLGTSSLVPSTAGQPFTVNMFIRSTVASSSASYRQAINLQGGIHFIWCWGDAGLPDSTGVYRNSAAAYFSNTGNSLSSATTYMATVSYDGADLKTYINGTLVGTNNIGSQTRWTAGTNNHIGASQAPGDYFDGNIGRLGIWDRALTGSEITELYNGGAGLTYPFPSPPTVNSNFFALM